MCCADISYGSSGKKSLVRHLQHHKHVNAYEIRCSNQKLIVPKDRSKPIATTTSKAVTIQGVVINNQVFFKSLSLSLCLLLSLSNRHFFLIIKFKLSNQIISSTDMHLLLEILHTYVLQEWHCSPTHPPLSQTHREGLLNTCFPYFFPN